MAHMTYKCSSRNRLRKRLPEQKLLGISILWNTILKLILDLIENDKGKKTRAKFNFLGISKAMCWKGWISALPTAMEVSLKTSCELEEALVLH